VTSESAVRRAFAVLGAACALVPALAMWGFTVDDALIPVRYAHNLATGAGYRFDAHGPSTDGVTPLPWAFLLAPLSGGDGLTALVRAKVLGIACWTLGGGALGDRVGRMVSGGPRVPMAMAALGLAVMGLAFPIGAWAASGMETGAATALATVAVARLGRSRPNVVAALAGGVATLRPEMVVWAIALAVGAAVLGSSESEETGARAGVPAGARAAAVAAAPFLLCAAMRLVVFGRPAPLAVLAKPSDLAHGALYVGAATLVTLTPLLATAPVAFVRGAGRELGLARVVIVAFAAHAMAVVAAGGDWMPYARLMVPVAPSLVLAFVALLGSSRLAFVLARLAAAIVLGGLLAVRAAPAGRGVHADRADLIVRARPVLAGAHVVAALDIGWASAATEASIVDLAGLTDASIAILPGGHTSKRVDTSMLLDRGVDTVLVYSDIRVVEVRIVRSELFTSRFEKVAELPVGSRGAFYTVYRLRPRAAEPSAP
jgi:hypothetical protein